MSAPLMPDPMTRLSLPPANADPIMRLAFRIQQLESRLQAIERRRDTYVTPLSVSLLTTATVTFEWHGGALWVLYGGSGAAHDATPRGIRVGAQVGSMPATTVASESVTYTTVTNAVVALSMAAFNVDPQYLTPGTNTVLFSYPGGAGLSNSATLSGLIIESPAP